MTCPSIAMSEFEIQSALGALEGWRYHEGALERVYKGNTYLDALQALNRVAEVSEAANHHPDLLLSWKTLTIRYWTHTAQGITALDFDLAAQVNTVLYSKEK